MNFGFTPGVTQGLISLEKPVFAIDVGGVLANKQHEGVAVRDSLDAIRCLRWDYDLWIISQCGRNRALMTEQWLTEQGFDPLIPQKKQIYVPFGKERHGEELAKVAALRELRATRYVDDRLKHVLPACKHVPSLISVFFFGATESDAHDKVVAVPDWASIMKHLGY